MDQTKTDKSRQLSEQQLNAVEYILQGMSDRVVAEKCNVTRQTIWEWRNRDPLFIAALNQRRQEVWAGSRERLKNLATKALDVFERSLDNEDPKIQLVAAQTILKRVIPDNITSPTGPTTAEGVIYQWERDKVVAEVDKANAGVFYSILDADVMSEIDTKTEARMKKALKKYGF